MDDAGERLAQRRFLEAQGVREAGNVALGNDDVWREPAIDAGSNRAPFRAEIGLPSPTEAARPAEMEVGLGRDAIARGYPGDLVAGGRDLPRQLMTQDHRRLGGVLVVVDVQVGTADTGGTNREEHLSRTRLR